MFFFVLCTRKKEEKKMKEVKDALLKKLDGLNVKEVSEFVENYCKDMDPTIKALIVIGAFTTIYGLFKNQ